MPDSNKIKLPDFIYSHEQIGLYLLQLEHYKSVLLKNKVGGGSGLGTQKERRDGISGQLERYLIETAPKEGVTYEFLEEISGLLNKVRDTGPRLHLTFASLPNAELKRQLTAWARENIHELALVSFHYDQSIIGGVVIRTRNKIFDFSYAKNLKNPKIKITSILND